MNCPRTLLLIFIALSTGCFGANRFVENGLPTPSREWYGREYALAAELLTKGGVSLPTFDNGDGEKIFRRLVNIENFSLARNLSLPFDQRMENALAMQEAVSTITKKYVAEANRGAALHRELAELVAFSLRMCTVMFALVDEFIPTIKKDERYEIRMDGLRKMKTGLEGIFSSAEVSLGERIFYADSDLKIMLNAMSETLPHFTAVFSDDFRTEIRARLRKRAREFQSEDMRAMTESMLKTLGDQDKTSRR